LRILEVLRKEFSSWKEFTIKEAQAAIRKHYDQQFHQLYLKSQGYDNGWQLVDFTDRIQRRLNRLVSKNFLLVRKMNRNYFYQLNPDKYL
jgi:hypothetical protein